MLNKKRRELAEIEARYGVTLEVMIDESFEGARMSVESSGARPNPKDRAIAPPIVDDDDDDLIDDIQDEWAASPKLVKGLRELAQRAPRAR